MITSVPAGGLVSELKIPQAVKDQYSKTNKNTEYKVKVHWNKSTEIKTILVFSSNRFYSSMPRELSVTFVARNFSRWKKAVEKSK